MGSEGDVDVPVGQRQPRTRILRLCAKHQRSSEVGSGICGGYRHPASAYVEAGGNLNRVEMEGVLRGAAGWLGAGDKIHDVGGWIDHRRTQNTEPGRPGN